MTKSLTVVAAFSLCLGFFAADFQLGCAEKELEVPLFAELSGYGAYCERRNLGVIEPLYCRAVSFNVKGKRAMIVYTDALETALDYAREMRKAIAEKFAVSPDGIAFVATHTHSGPALHADVNGLSFGIPHPAYQKTWRKAVMEVAEKAIANEEDIADVIVGRSVPSEKISRNRVEREKNITDPAIRWARFRRPDGTTKLFIHNFGMHPVTTNGKVNIKYASSDWPGCTNRLIRERGLADMAVLFLGPAGDQMPKKTSIDQNSEEGTMIESVDYMNALMAGLGNGKKISVDNLSFTLKTVRMPVRVQTADELRADAKTLRDEDARRGESYWKDKATRLEEMAMLVEKGRDLGTSLDFQVIRLGGIHFFMVPGEPYVEPGIRLLEQAKCEFPFLVTMANGAGSYFFTKSSGERYPDMKSRDNKVFGFYEINLYMLAHRFRYENNVADFVMDTLLQME
ncbi:MAG: hypothetical protein MJ025_00355 [Victivallaceae bacterium]|nr:hypothetical protein [Victivallaceae bacterium]